ncbi:hypothetical protein OAT18_00220 [Tenacibaculum sp.]|nr:hypothetical protein [Tenacibaculum sp.]
MKKNIYIIFIFLLSTIVSINYFTNKKENKERDIEKKYFETLDLKLEGRVCNVEKMEKTYGFLITLTSINSNLKNYSKEVLKTIFCVKKRNTVVFADSDSYEIDDIVSIGSDINTLIVCKDYSGKIKFLKKRKQGMLFHLRSPKKRMIKLLEEGCELGDSPDGASMPN